MTASPSASKSVQLLVKIGVVRLGLRSDSGHNQQVSSDRSEGAIYLYLRRAVTHSRRVR